MNAPSLPRPIPPAPAQAAAAQTDAGHGDTRHSPSLEPLAERLRAMAHPVRLTVLETLSGQDRCVCGEIVRALPLAQSTVSQHLKVLLDAGLIRSRTEGQRSSYCLDRDAVRTLKAEIDTLFSALLAPAECCMPRDDNSSGFRSHQLTEPAPDR